MNRHTSYFFCVGMACLLSACTSTTSENSGEQDSLADITSDSVTNKPIRDILELGLPEMLNAQVEYDETLINPLDYIDEYLLTDDKAAANLGIYGADALYLSLYHKTSEYMQHSNACQRMATELGVQEAFTPEMIRRLEDNTGNSDSIYAILSESIHTTDSVLKADGQERMAGLMATGSLVESLHMLSQSLNSLNISAENRSRVIDAIVKQKTAVSKVKKRLEALPTDKILVDLQTKLAVLEAAINAAETHGYASEYLKAVIASVEKLRAGIIN